MSGINVIKFLEICQVLLSICLHGSNDTFLQVPVLSFINCAKAMAQHKLSNSCPQKLCGKGDRKIKLSHKFKTTPTVGVLKETDGAVKSHDRDFTLFKEVGKGFPEKDKLRLREKIRN